MVVLLYKYSEYIFYYPIFTETFFNFSSVHPLISKSFFFTDMVGTVKVSVTPVMRLVSSMVVRDVTSVGRPFTRVIMSSLFILPLCVFFVLNISQFIEVINEFVELLLLDFFDNTNQSKEWSSSNHTEYIIKLHHIHCVFNID